MTLAIGVKLEESVLLCADTLYSDGFNKVYRTKLFPWSGKSANVGFAIAGNANIARAVVDACRDALDQHRGAPLTERKVVSHLSGVLAECYWRYIDSRPYEDRTDARYALLVAVSANGGATRLYSASGSPALAEVDKYECIGSGEQIARFIIESGHDPRAPEMTFTLIEPASVLAIQALMSAKDHTEGVGGESEFLMVEPERVSDVIPFSSRLVEPLARQYQHYALSLLSTLADPSAHESWVEDMLDGFVKFCRRTRKEWARWTLPPELMAFVLAAREREAERAKQFTQRRQERRETQSTRKAPNRGRKVQPQSRV